MTDYGKEHNAVFVVHLHKTGELRHFDIVDIRMEGNATYGIPEPAMPEQGISALAKANS